MIYLVLDNPSLKTIHFFRILLKLLIHIVQLNRLGPGDQHPEPGIATTLLPHSALLLRLILNLPIKISLITPRSHPPIPTPLLNPHTLPLQHYKILECLPDLDC